MGRCFQKVRILFIRRVSSGDRMGSMSTIVNNTIYRVLETQIDLKCSHHTHKC